MGKHRYNNRRHPSVMLDAGYVSIKAVDICKSSKIIGLHGKKLLCVISTVFILFSISCINLTCLIWVMYKLDWTPFHNNGSKVFRFDKINQQIELYHQGIFHEAIYTTKINDVSPIDLLFKKEIEMYGDHNSILLDDNQISMTTENFYINNEYLVDFNNLELFKFDDNRRTRIHLNHINSQHIHSQYLNITADHHLKISKVNHVLLSGKNLTIEGNRNNRRSLLCFDGYPRKKKSLDRRQEVSHSNIHFRTDSVFLDLPRLPLIEYTNPREASIYRVCICNASFLLLRSIAHQPCPLC